MQLICAGTVASAARKATAANVMPGWVGVKLRPSCAVGAF